MATDYPEHEKMRDVQVQSQAIGRFLEWLQEEKIVLAKYEGNRDFPWPIHENIESLLARHFEIDLKVIEQEKQAMLDFCRAQQS